MTANESTAASRLTFVAVVVGVLFLALLSRLWFLQVLAGERYVELAESNRVQIVYTEAPRGRILAADGAELVKNRPAQTISAHPRELLDEGGEPAGPEEQAVVQRLSMLLGMTRDDILARLTDRSFSPFRPVPIAFDVPAEVVFAVREHQELFQGVVAETLPVRTYPAVTTAAHILGYVGEISQDQLEQDYFAGYRAGDVVGQAGLERAYDHELQGEEGARVLEVNRGGTVLTVDSVREPVPGNDLVTSIDVELQQQVERLLADGLVQSRRIVRDDGRRVKSTAGAAVVLDPTTGAVLAMTSNPTYDPREFIGGVSPDYWTFVNADDKHVPLRNRAIQSTHPPGSTFKLVTGASFLATDLVAPSTPVPCPSSWSLGGTRFNNWNSSDEGAMGISQALQRSCDTYFYELASRQWAATRSAEDPQTVPMAEMARRFGFDEPLGIDLPAEAGGIVPDPAFKQARWDRLHDQWCAQAEETGDVFLRDNCQYGYLWRGGDPVNMAIGQGDVTATPLQVAAAFGAIANDGAAMWPHVGARIVDPDGDVVEQIEPRVVDEVPLTDGEVAAIQDGLQAVVMDPRGTAASAFVDFDFDRLTVAGKTGTAEAGSRIPFAWFAAYAPADDPEVAVAVMVEEGSGGSVTAAPIARRILEAAFDLPISGFQAGTPTD